MWAVKMDLDVHRNLPQSAAGGIAAEPVGVSEKRRFNELWPIFSQCFPLSRGLVP